MNKDLISNNIMMLKERKYTPGQIDNKWSEEIEKDFSRSSKKNEANSHENFREQEFLSEISFVPIVRVFY